MQLTTEQERAVMRGADRHVDRIRRAMADARNIKAMHKWVWRALDKAARAA
jgi:hypothetical protein